MRFLFMMALFVASNNMLLAQQPDTAPLIIAHRGASGYAPENTIASIDKALELGADVIEIDVHQTKDGVVVVMHDEKLDRTTDKSGLIKDHNWDDIKDADAGGWFNEKFAGVRIPTLEEVIAHINGRAQLLIEIKKGGDYYPGIEQRVLTIIKAASAERWCMIQSFSDDAVTNFRCFDSGLKIYKLTLRAGKRSIRGYGSIAGVNPNHSFASKRTIRNMHERGKQVFVWTVNDEKDMKKLVERGVDGIITNYPDKLKAVIAAGKE